jgi:predicted O-methyltransferase YrrM
VTARNGLTQAPHTIYPEIEGWCWDNDLRHLRRRARDTEPLGGPILEIGSFCGLSTAVLSERGASVVCVDPFMGGEDLPVRDTYHIFKAHMERLGRWEQLMVYRKQSRLFFWSWPEHRQFRLIFIDGSHTYENCLADIQRSYPLLKSGGYMLIDDAHDNLLIRKALVDCGHSWYQVTEPELLKMAEIHKP